MIQIEGEEVSDRVGVFGAIEAVDGWGAGVWFAGKVFVEGFFYMGDYGRSCFIGEFGAGRRRHLASADFAEDFFPFGDSRGNVCCF